MKNFTDEEEALIRAFVFTNPNGDFGLVYPQPLVAGEELSPLMSAVSRTHVSMQDRTLTFLDREKTEQTRAYLPAMRQTIDIFRLPDGQLNTSRKTTTFNREWVIVHGHSSIKEGTVVFGHAEDTSDISIKLITGHPLNHPQVKSTRYISYKKVLDRALTDPDILALPDSGQYVEFIDHLNRRYLEVTDTLADRVATTEETRKILAYLRRPENVEAEVQKKIANKKRIEEDYEPTPADVDRFRAEILESLDESAARKDVGKFVLDYSRVFLTAANRTSGVFSVDARTLEEIITTMISSPRKEDQKRGYELFNEAKKIAPVLLGERSHIKIDEWRVRNEQELRAYVQEQFGNLTPRNRATGMANLLHPRNIEMYTDRFNAALVVFQYSDLALQDIMEQLTDGDVKKVLAKAHQYRGLHDVIHPAISHGGLMLEAVMGYHAYRDIFRQRRGSRTTQLLTTRLGFEVPEIFKIFGLKDEYLRDMQQAAQLFEQARAVSPHAAEKLVPFGALCRALHSWQVNQLGYVGQLRGDIEKGNRSYVLMVRELLDKATELMPETARYFRVDRREFPPDLWKRGYGWYDAEVRRKQ